MSKTRFEILASAAQTAVAQGSGIAVSGIKNLLVMVDVTVCSASLSVWMQGSSDGGTTWADIPFDWCLENAVTTHTEGRHFWPGVNSTSTTGNNNVAFEGTRNMIDRASSATRRVMAKYTTFGDYVRAAWNVSGSGATSTFSVKGIGEN